MNQTQRQFVSEMLHQILMKDAFERQNGIGASRCHSKRHGVGYRMVCHSEAKRGIPTVPNPQGDFQTALRRMDGCGRDSSPPKTSGSE